MKYALILILLFTGTASAKPFKDNRNEYATSLNSMVSTIMNWYGNMLPNEQTNFVPTKNILNKFQLTYPQNITQIQIADTEFTRSEKADYYVFNINTLISYKTKKGLQSQTIDESFTFYMPPLAKPVIYNITRHGSAKVTTEDTTEFNQHYFKARKFAYAWLAYMDGVKGMSKDMDANLWIDTAQYSLKRGSTHAQDKVDTLLAKRKLNLGKGGHLLRTIDVFPVTGSKDTFTLELVIEYNGTSPSGKPTLAKIKQTFTYRVTASGAWKVHSVKETYLLPNIAPWIGLLC